MNEPQSELNNQPIVPQEMPQESQEPVQMPEPMPPKHFGPKFIITLVIVLIVAGGAFGAIWWWGSRSSQVAVPSATPDQTADWKTYTNTQYGFEFKYPSSIYFSSEGLSKDGGYIIIFVGDKQIGELGPFFQIQIEKTNLDNLDNYLESLGLNISNFNLTNLDDASAVSQQSIGKAGLKSAYTIIAIKNKQAFILDFDSSSGEDRNLMEVIFKEMISTFKFIP